MLIRRRRSSRTPRPPRERVPWRALAFEVFAVVLGVTLALGANEIRQHFADARRVEVATESIAAEIQQNCDQLTRTLAYHERVITAIDSVRGANPEAMESFESMQRAVSAWQGYNPAFVISAAFETARATGALGLMPYERALGIGSYYALVDLYRETVSQSFGAVIQAGEPSVSQVMTAIQVTTELERQLGPQSCKAAAQLRGESGVENEPTESASDTSSVSS